MANKGSETIDAILQAVDKSEAKPKPPVAKSAGGKKKKTVAPTFQKGKPLVEQFPTLLYWVKDFCKNSTYGKNSGLHVVNINNANQEYEIRSKVTPGKALATIRRGRGWHTVNVGSLLREFKHHSVIKYFF